MVHAAPLEKTDVGAVWAALNLCGSHADMDVDFDLYDKQAAEDELIARAVAQARGNAEALAAASRTKLAGVKHISYNSYGDSAASGRSYVCAASAAPMGADETPRVELEPEPIKVECSVDMEWWLE